MYEDQTQNEAEIHEEYLVRDAPQYPVPCHSI